MMLMLALAVWSFTYALHWLTFDPALRVFWLYMTYFGVVVSPVAFFVMTLQFIGQDVSRRAYLRSSALYRRQAHVLLAGTLLPWLVNFLALAGWNPLPGLDLTPLAFTASNLFFAYSFFGYRMMDLVPVSRDVLVENLDDGIVVVDTQGRIVDLNPKAMELVDPGLEMPYGKSFCEVFSRWGDIISTYSGLEGRAEVKLDNAPITHLDLRVIPMKDRRGTLMGKLVTWRDISARKQAEEQLRVFFRAVKQNPVAIVITDAEGRIEYVNLYFVRLTGYSLEEVRGRASHPFPTRHGFRPNC